MELNESKILKTTLRKIFPFVILFSFYMFSYGANFPGGGFQAGVIAGTIIIVYQLIFRNKKYPDFFYKVTEFIGMSIMLVFLLAGLFLTEKYFGGFYIFQSKESLIFSNAFIWTLNLAIYLEVSGSIVLIFRYITEDI
ncbi:MAG: MnhB domain-containing protein [Candidatus Muiribacteriota bacterium]